MSMYVLRWRTLFRDTDRSAVFAVTAPRKAAKQNEERQGP